MAAKFEEFNNEELAMEITRLKTEQRELDKEVEDMNNRLETTERRPEQMMAFLRRVVEDPDLLPRMMLQKERTRRSTDKKRRLAVSSSAASSSSAVSSSVKSELEEEGTVGAISSPEITCRIDVDNSCFCQSSPSPEPILVGNYICCPSPIPVTAVSLGGGFGNGVTVAVSPVGNSCIGYGGGGGQISYFSELAPPPPPYPFSLLGGGF